MYANVCGEGMCMHELVHAHWGLGMTFLILVLAFPCIIAQVNIML